MKSKLPPESLRVPPEIASHLVAHICNYGWDVKWDKPEHDSHTVFTCTSVWMRRVQAFVDGVKIGMEVRSI